MNLITSCESCNLGKSDIPLNDNSVVEKQRHQLELEQEAQDPSKEKLNFYSNNKVKGGYIIEMKQTALDEETGTNRSVEIQMYLNQYFYVTAEYVMSDGIYEAIEINWLG